MFSCKCRSVLSGQVTHDAPEASECLYPVVDVEQVEPFRSLQYRMTPVLVLRYRLWKVASGYEVEVSTVYSQLEDRDVIVHA